MRVMKGITLPLEDLANLGQTVHFVEDEKVIPAIITASAEGRQTLYCLDPSGGVFTRQNIVKASNLTQGCWTPRPAAAAEQTRHAGI